MLKRADSVKQLTMLDDALSVADKYVDKYLPDKDPGEDVADKPSKDFLLKKDVIRQVVLGLLFSTHAQSIYYLQCYNVPIMYLSRVITNYNIIYYSPNLYQNMSAIYCVVVAYCRYRTV